jgi:hypothetical protein
MELGLRETALPNPNRTLGATSLNGDLREGARLSAFLVIEAARQLVRAEFDLELSELDRPTPLQPQGRAHLRGASKLYGTATLDIVMQQADTPTRGTGRFDTTEVTSSLAVTPSRAALLLVTPEAIHAALAQSHPVFAKEYCQRVVSMHQAELATQRLA